MVEVTVLMAVYNGERYLIKSIESVLAQTYTNFEFLIINDCSSDGTMDIISGFRDPRIILVQNEKNMGQTESLNLGLKLSKGKYIARIDADDKVSPFWLEMSIPVLTKDPSLAVVSCAANVIDENDIAYKNFFSAEHFEDIKLRSLLESPINHVGSLIRRSAVLKIGGYPSDYHVSADFFLWIKLIHNDQRMSSLRNRLVDIRIHKSSLSRRMKIKELQELTNVIKFYVYESLHFKPSDIDLERLVLINYAPENIEEDAFWAGIKEFNDFFISMEQKGLFSKARIAYWRNYFINKLVFKRCQFLLIDSKFFEIKQMLSRLKDSKIKTHIFFDFLAWGGVLGGKGIILIFDLIKIMRKMKAVFFI